MTFRRVPPSTYRRRVAGATLAVLTAGALSACQLASPTTTDLDYDPADGVSADVGDLGLLNVLIVSEGEGEPGIVTGMVANRGSEDVTLTIETADRTPLEPPVEVPAGSEAWLDGRSPFGEEGDPVVLPAVPGPPGAFIDLRLTASTGEAASVIAPVQTPEGPYTGYSPADGAAATGAP